MTERCDGCKCFMPMVGSIDKRRGGKDEDRAIGYCRRNPPTAEHGGEIVSMPTKVSADWWCYEFKLGETKPKDATE